ncbi:MAG TPA: hypothetical protein VNO70_05165 [Blastocatellia bacterium]|nr:hypothetical protein [Blastocatellia bacterium]
MRVTIIKMQRIFRRPAGPIGNSHVRQGVELIGRSAAPAALRSVVDDVDHALSGAATACRLCEADTETIF